MTYTQCFRCGEKFHLRITSNEALGELRKKEEAGEVLCLGCFKSLKDYDVVKTISENTNVPEAKIGDVGTIILAHDGGLAFEVECVLENGDTKWLGAFSRQQLKWVQSPAE